MFQKRKSKLLLSAIVEGQAARVKSLLNSGADPNHPDPQGRTPLMLAAEEGQTGISQDLIRAGANVNLRSKSGERALMFAAKKGSAPVMELLLKAGAKVNAKDKYGNTALMSATIWATRMASIGIADTEQKVALLLNAGAKVNAADSNGCTPLMTAIRSGGGSLEEVTRLPVLQILLDHKAEVNTQSKKGRTVLMSAAFRGLKDSFKFLVDAGADFNLADLAGRTALMYAARGCFWSYRQAGYISIVNILLNKGVELTTMDNHGNTAFMIAKMYDRSDIQVLLKKAGARF